MCRLEMQPHAVQPPTAGTPRKPPMQHTACEHTATAAAAFAGIVGCATFQQPPAAATLLPRLLPRPCEPQGSRQDLIPPQEDVKLSIQLACLRLV